MIRRRRKHRFVAQMAAASPEGIVSYLPVDQSCQAAYHQGENVAATRLHE